MGQFRGFIKTGDQYSGDGHIFEVYRFDYANGARWRAQEMDGADDERNVCGPTFFGATHTEVAGKCMAYHLGGSA